MRWSLRASSFAVVILASACRDEAGVRPTLVATGGTYQDGSGRAGLAVLATLRDGAGAGPSQAWDVTLRDGSGVAGYASYQRAGAGSYEVWLWPEVAPSDQDAYGVTATDADMSGATVPGPFSVSEHPYLPASFVAE